MGMSRITPLLYAYHTTNGIFLQDIPQNGVVDCCMHIRTPYFFVHIDGKTALTRYLFSPHQTNIHGKFVNI
jgi:hypothetical protein